MFLTGSKVGLGTPWRRIRDLFGPPLGLESCWGFAVSHASSTPCSRCPEVQANRGTLAVHCTVNFFFIWAPFRMHGRDTKVRHELSPGPSVFNGFEGRVRHTLASHSGPFWATFLGLNPAGVSLFRMHRPLHVLGALKFKPTEAHLPSTARLTFSSSGCRFACVAEALVLVFLNGSKVG